MSQFSGLIGQFCKATPVAPVTSTDRSLWVRVVAGGTGGGGGGGWAQFDVESVPSICNATTLTFGNDSSIVIRYRGSAGHCRHGDSGRSSSLEFGTGADPDLTFRGRGISKMAYLQIKKNCLPGGRLSAV